MYHYLKSYQLNKFLHFIKKGMTCTEEEIEAFCKGLPRYKRPKKIIFADVPRNATGKIEKPALRKKYGADQLVAQQNKG